MWNLIIRLHVEGDLSEGQVARATGMHRIAIRKAADDAANEPCNLRAVADDETVEEWLARLHAEKGNVEPW
jgi:hypothetical protein